ncbi:olfactory receptor 7E24-like [Castor canadensis]|uniref:Olfactory receptor 7E24-like n=1 Tax=Castor canadensis TaxID=51338 RepID=A0A8B7TNB5_CASCN
MYLITVLGNLLIIPIVNLDSHLHTPMYYFLSNLSLADICFISTIVTKMIVDIQIDSRTITYEGCLTQMDDMLRTVMVYDRFVAICHPLYYFVIMNHHLCGFLLLVSFLFSILDAQLHYLFALHFPYFKDVEISNFFCDPSHLLNLVCSDNFSSSIVKYFTGVVFGFVPISGILFSYCKIIASILKILSSGGRFKAFSTCGSHLLVVCLFYGTSIGVYLGSAFSEYPRNVLVASITYTVVIPMLNPFICSLRNRDIESALSRIHVRTIKS